MNARLKFAVLTFSALLAVAITLSLGRWQLSRAARKEAIQASMDANAALPRLAGQSLAGGGDLQTLLHRRVLLRGRWLALHTVFLDNRQMNDKQGFYVVTPMQIEGSAAVVLVQRGWVARDFMDRTRLPQIETPAGSVEIEGRIVPPPSSLFEFGGPEAGRIRQNLDRGRFSAELGLPLLPVSVQQSGTTRDGLLRDWPKLGSGVAMHYGYAFQWFALSTLITILYVWFQLVRRFIPSR